MSRLICLLLAGVLLAGCTAGPPTPAAPGSSDAPVAPSAAGEVSPDWARDAVWYQIFPERFRNGDPTNDPTRASLEYGIEVPESWEVSSWTGDWYARADWEEAMGNDFYASDAARAAGRGEGKDIITSRRYGGDIQGVIDKLDYLDELGVNAIYFNPMFYARSHHKYDGNTFHHIDPYLGPDPEGDFALMARETSDPSTWQWTAADRLFFDMVGEAHARGIRIVIDGVFNHVGRDFFAFADLQENQAESPYKDWFIVERFDDPSTPQNEFDYKGWWGVETLPEFSDTPDGTDLHPGPKQYVYDATRRWMDPNGDGDPSDGVDGWRLDVVPDVPIGFWADWNAYARTINPAVYTISEVWQDASRYINDAGFDATMNYYGFAFPVKGYLVDNASTPSEFAEQLVERQKVYPEEARYHMQNLMDSHDTQRLASMIVNAGRQPYENPEQYDYDVGSRVSAANSDTYDIRKPNARERQIQRLVALFQMTYVGSPMIYYGTEAGMWGGDDPDDRMPMVWPDLTYQPQRNDPRGLPRRADPVVFDSALYDFYSDVIALRNEHEALRRGDFRVLAADDERNIFAFSRTLGDETVIVILNRSDEANSIRIPLPEELRKQYEAAFTTGADDPHRVQQDQTALLLEISDLSGLVLTQR